MFTSSNEGNAMTEKGNTPGNIVYLSSARYLAVCGGVAAGLLMLGRMSPFPAWLVAVEVVATVLALFIFGSIRYRLDKNALTYGAALIIGATFWESWWRESALRASLAAGEPGALWAFVWKNFLTLDGLDKLVHADTMLFILGLTFFVAVIAQTRLLETASFAVLNKNKGRVVPTVAALAALVAAASGILDGVSMIGLMIRTLIIILFLSKAGGGAAIYAVMVSTVVTTVCGMWLAYGEPPNLIMKSNLQPHLDDAFFLRYCLPVAVGSYFIVFWNVSRKLKGKSVKMDALDLLDRHTADVRFLQATRHGEVLTPVEFAAAHAELLGEHLEPVQKRLHKGEPLGEAMSDEHVPPAVRKELLGKFVAENMAETLDDYYVHVFGRDDRKAGESARKLAEILETVRKRRVWAQRVGGLAFLPFIGFLVWHAMNHDVPLFLASFAGFFAALPAIYAIPKMRGLALRDAKHEFSEYLFLIPLFLSITLLQKTGFFEQLTQLLHVGVEKLGASHVAYAQFLGTTFLSALLDNNVVADFAGRAIRGMEISVLHLFAMAQISGYALGGCWTHIGSAQSVVAYAFIRKEIDSGYTPFQWIKAMTPVVVELGVFITFMVYLEGWLMPYLSR
jgi:Na+/H+ antiporter NhaD/arsenite permease-like protein